MRKYEVRYELAWQIYLDAEDPESKAYVVVDNRDFSCPTSLKPRQATESDGLPHGNDTVEG